MCFAPQRRAFLQHLKYLNVKKWSVGTPQCLDFWLENVLRATTARTFLTSQLPKVVWDCEFLTLLTWKCASRHNGVHFFDIATSKSGLRPWVFDTFDLEMCFAPQGRVLFRPRNFQKWSERVLFLALLLQNVLRTTTACNFSSLIWPAGSAPAAFSKPTFRPSGATNLLENTLNRDFPPFRAPASSFFSLFLFSDLLTSFLLLFDSSHLFPSVHIVGSLTSKLPSMTDKNGREEPLPAPTRTESQELSDSVRISDLEMISEHVGCCISSNTRSNNADSRLVSSMLLGRHK